MEGKREEEEREGKRECRERKKSRNDGGLEKMRGGHRERRKCVGMGCGAASEG